MPSYDYRCEKCGETFEVFQSMTEDPLTKHPDCGGKAARVFSPVGIAFKGSGFYKNDHGSRAGGSSKEKKESTTPTSASSSTSSDSSSSSTSNSSSASTTSTSSDSKPSSAKSDSKPSKSA